MAIVLACIVLAACRERCQHAPGGPYYFESAVDYSGWCPKREISKAQANELAKDGYAYYVATYDANGNPTNIDKIYQGRTEAHIELLYRQKVLREVRIVKKEGVRIHQFDERGKPILLSEEQ